MSSQHITHVFAEKYSIANDAEYKLVMDKKVSIVDTKLLKTMEAPSRSDPSAREMVFKFQYDSTSPLRSYEKQTVFSEWHAAKTMQPQVMCYPSQADDAFKCGHTARGKSFASEDGDVLVAPTSIDDHYAKLHNKPKKPRLSNKVDSQLVPERSRPELPAITAMTAWRCTDASRKLMTEMTGNFWVTQENVLQVRGRTAMRCLQDVMNGGAAEGDSWLKNIKPAARKNWASIAAHADNTLMKNVDPAMLRNGIEELQRVLSIICFLILRPAVLYVFAYSARPKGNE